MPAKNFYIAIYDANFGSLQFPYYADEYGDIPTHRQLWKRIAEYIFRTQQPVSVSAEVFKMFAKPQKVEHAQVPVGCWLGVPLKAHNMTIGVLAIQNYTEGMSMENGINAC